MNDLMVSVFVQDDGNFLITADNGKTTFKTVSNEKMIIAKVIWLQFKVWLNSLLKK
jgi:hypothetical protein